LIVYRLNFSCQGLIRQLLWLVYMIGEQGDGYVWYVMWLDRVDVLMQDRFETFYFSQIASFDGAMRAKLSAYIVGNDIKGLASGRTLPSHTVPLSSTESYTI